jgi:DNA-binding response OmpR family regulator
MRVLVAEDDPGLRSVLARGLREHGYIVDAVVNGTEALSYLRSYVYEVVVLDWRMPKQSGMDVLTAMRSHGDHTPVLMLTARDAIEDRVAGLNKGADDYLVKPFSFSELVARISALQRRPALTLDPVLTCGDLVFDPTTRIMTRDDDPVALTSIETRLMELLMRRAPAVVSRRTIALQVWDDEADAVGSNTIEVHVGRLRAKLAGAAAHIETVRGIGYRMVG